MPSYLYICNDCEEATEITHSIHDCDNPRPCGKCANPMQREIQPMSQFQQVWKCDLWTRDDYTKSGRPIKS